MKEKNVRDINRKISYTLSFLGGGGMPKKRVINPEQNNPTK